MINLAPYVGKTVMVQLKAPYLCRLATTHDGRLIPLALVFEEGKPPRLASDHDPPELVRPMAVDVLIGEVKEIVFEQQTRPGDMRNMGPVYLLRIDTPGTKDKSEVQLSEDLILAVTYLPEPGKIVMLGGGR